MSRIFLSRATLAVCVGEVLLGLMIAGCEDPAAIDLAQIPEHASEPARSPEEVYAPIPTEGVGESEEHVIPAVALDRDYDRDGTVAARRLVYRARLAVPEGFGRASFTVSPPSAELYVDVSDDRLRATFAGHGWPVEGGSEIRLRSDEAGVYVFDGRGGRSLGPGQLAAWFNGGPLESVTARYRVIASPPNEQLGPGRLLCRLIAEWTSQSAETVVGRCGVAGSPMAFQIGPWVCDRTADVAIELPRRSLRADHLQPPETIEKVRFGQFLSDAMVRRIRRHNRPPPIGYVSAEGSPEAGLRIRNRSSAKTIILVNGIPIGWIEAESEAWFESVPTGLYQLAAMRVFGVAARLPQVTVIPNLVTL